MGNLFAVRSFWKLWFLEPRHTTFSPVFVPLLNPGVWTDRHVYVLEPFASLVTFTEQVLALEEVRVHHIASNRLILLLKPSQFYITLTHPRVRPRGLFFFLFHTLDRDQEYGKLLVLLVFLEHKDPPILWKSLRIRWIFFLLWDFSCSPHCYYFSFWRTFCWKTDWRFIFIWKNPHQILSDHWRSFIYSGFLVALICNQLIRKKKFYYCEIDLLKIKFYCLYTEPCISVFKQFQNYK